MKSEAEKATRGQKMDDVRNLMPTLDEVITEEWEYLTQFSRALALADGQLVDMTEPAKLFGFKGPVLFSHSAWVEVVAEYCRGSATLEVDRVNAVLLALRDAIARHRRHASGRIYFRVATCDGDGVYYDIALIARQGRGDAGQEAWAVTTTDQE